MNQISSMLKEGEESSISYTPFFPQKTRIFVYYKYAAILSVFIVNMDFSSPFLLF